MALCHRVFSTMPSCTVTPPLSVTLPNGSNATRFGNVNDSTPDDCIPHSLVGQTVTTKALNAAGTFSVSFPTEIIDAAAGQFKINFNLKDQPMQVGTYRLEVTVKDKPGNVLKSLAGVLNIQREPA